MFRQVIRPVIQNIRTVKNVLFSTNTENVKLEKTVNQVTLLGRVGGDAQKRGNEEHPVVIFSLATHSNYKYTNGDFMQRTDWHRICVFKPNLRETVATYLRKGQRVLVVGKISYGEFKDEQGITKPSTAVIADDVIFFQSL
ncbi:PREDICTED: single-stranded DNA-binding protein, mitochondrial [Eufriesea mexicana]|uniref:single-stranded DNA-binding protein, mitochondrial n=1 Tax=Eufriesea mexicana TaxID=516756 RepID=UPI00083C6711|nr:PREDICTED: single-stranded DNA-binding protein, mitochondrial [Eufriesea mexicana]